MDEEANQQQGAEPVNVAEMPFAELQAQMRAGKFDAAEQVEPDFPDTGDAATPPDGQSEEARDETAAGADAQQGEGRATEDDGQGQAAQSGEQQPQEDWKRKFDSVAGNNKTLSQQLQQANQALRAMQAQMAQTQVQQQRQVAEFQAAQQIAQTGLPPEQQQQALQEWRERQQAQYQQQDHQQGLEAYRQYLLQNQAQQQQVGVQLFRMATMQDIDGLAEHIATRYEAPSEPLIEMTKSPAFKDVWGYVNTQEDLDLVAQVMAAAAETFRARDGSRKEANRQQAIVQQTHRIEQGNGGASGSGGKTPAEKIAGMTDAEFRKFQTNLRRQGSMRGLV